ncbi:uncharacterized protein L969DRAFT_15735 [Mixia osmundae IAM 14324]|uniref:Kinesin motor domain-containing protein n=1 Tax=Mixia osmundae (strain CBS 9802 / IAM 14324 / JCM 22182 / KY 12970) TaxID=764103 RepID=G7DTU3_MIXOS|nr:uncharacterized protein L969DRAFT_15735 [Mixia osmundae IAM 14324]KEI41717.1 hypothetical protein L969DRAFT_15735 [Mixia osmundae IAM 14324]GAA94003.1 hypothetical protein E5Q_00650 [Mixia osmundae IAM 14324]
MDRKASGSRDAAPAKTSRAQSIASRTLASAGPVNLNGTRTSAQSSTIPTASSSRARPGSTVIRPEATRPRPAVSTSASSSKIRPVPVANTAEASRSRPGVATGTQPAGPSTVSTRMQVVVRCRGGSAASSASVFARPDTQDSARATTFRMSPVKGTDIMVDVQTISSLPPPSPVKNSSAVLAGISPAGTSTIASKRETRYEYDHVFGPDADQGLLHTHVTMPILDQVIQGFSCTILAYGPTGTGKTHTMIGDTTPVVGTFAADAGIIPRSLTRLFHLLELQGTDYSVSVSFLEVYNEQIRDLSAPQQEGDEPVALDIYNDPGRPGAVTVKDMRETTITSADNGLAILRAGTLRRQTASTNCNDRSSRGHAIFTVKVTVKTNETDVKGEEVVRIGKLNLVDLAGSESIAKSGAIEARAREAGLINQSLLSLGRVINSLVEKSTTSASYRESKLTRLLEESLTGRTRTCLIATISTVKDSADETLKTLNYARRAKSIEINPQRNSTTTKSALISQYSIEIERLKRDLIASRTQQGVYFSDESWLEWSSALEERKRLIADMTRKNELYQSQLLTKDEQLEQTGRLLSSRDRELERLQTLLDQANDCNASLELQLMRSQTAEDVARQLSDQEAAKRLEYQQIALEAKATADGLIDKIARLQAHEQTTRATVTAARSALLDSQDALQSGIGTAVDSSKTALDNMKQAIATVSRDNAERLATLSGAHAQIVTAADVANKHMSTVAANSDAMIADLKDGIDGMLKSSCASWSRSLRCLTDQIDYALHLAVSSAKQQQKTAIAFLDEACRLSNDIQSTVDTKTDELTKQMSDLVGQLDRLVEADTTSQQADYARIEALAATDQQTDETRIKAITESVSVFLQEQLAKLADTRQKELQAKIATVKASSEKDLLERQGYCHAISNDLDSIGHGLRDLRQTTKMSNASGVELHAEAKARLPSELSAMATGSISAQAEAQKTLSTLGNHLDAHTAEANALALRVVGQAQCNGERAEASRTAIDTITNLAESASRGDASAGDSLVRHLHSATDGASKTVLLDLAETMSSVKANSRALTAQTKKLDALLPALPTGKTPAKRRWQALEEVGLEIGGTVPRIALAEVSTNHGGRQSIIFDRPTKLDRRGDTHEPTKMAKLS